MATERMAFESQLSVTNYSNFTTFVLDDDPDSPDGSWARSPDNWTNCDGRCSFATPAKPLVIGADLQEFRVLARQFDDGQSGTPDLRIELWEAGVLVRAGSNTSVTVGNPGEVHAFTWNANEISDMADVQCKVFGIKAGGSAGSRNTTEIGAIEWNAVTAIRGYRVPAGDIVSQGAVIGDITSQGLVAGDIVSQGAVIGDIM